MTTAITPPTQCQTPQPNRSFSAAAVIDSVVSVFRELTATKYQVKVLGFAVGWILAYLAIQTTETVQPYLRPAFSESAWSTKLVSTKEVECRCVHCEEDEECGGLWKANKFPTSINDQDLHSKKIHVVVSHCKQDLGWIPEYTKGFNIMTIHIISKCGQPVNGLVPHPATNDNTAEDLLPKITIEFLPNIGRCDHSYAHYLASIVDQKIAQGEEKDSIVLFIKDNVRNLHQPGQWANFQSMLQMASSANGFACGIDVTHGKHGALGNRDISPYHNSTVLSTFEMKNYGAAYKHGYKSDGVKFKSDFKGLGDFYAYIANGKRVLNPLVQVCYGGVFAATYTNIQKVDVSTWHRIEQTLSRGDNIEEGHHMERCWGPLLATPLKQFQVEAIQNYSTEVIMKPFFFRGMLTKAV